MTSPEPGPNRRLFMLHALPAVITLVLLVATQFADPDLWGRLSVGAVLDATGELPRADDFSFTAAGKPWIDHEWLTGVTLFAILSHGGEAGLMLFKYGMAGLALCLVFVAHRWLYRQSPVLTAYALAVLALAFMSAFVSTVRAQVFSVVFFLVFLLVLERIRLRKWDPLHVFWLLPLAVLWGNLHGGFIMGVMVVGLYGVGELWFRRAPNAGLLFGTAILMLGAVGVANPYGTAYLEFLIHAWTLDRSGISEWQPLFAGAWSAGKTYFAAVAIAAASVAAIGGWRAWRCQRQGREPGAADALAPALVLLLVIGMSLMARRIHPFMALALAFYLPLCVTLRRGARLPAASLFERGLPGAAGVLALILIAYVIPGRPFLNSFVPDDRSPGSFALFRFPVGAVLYLRESPYQGRLLNPFTSGEFLYWSLYPKFRVAIDGRYEEVYTQEQFAWVRYFYGPHPAAQTLKMAAQSRADMILFRAKSPHIETLDASPQWSLVYDDERFALVGRRKSLGSDPPFEFTRPRGNVRPTIASFFTPSDLNRFAPYPVE